MAANNQSSSTKRIIITVLVVVLVLGYVVYLAQPDNDDSQEQSAPGTTSEQVVESGDSPTQTEDVDRTDDHPPDDNDQDRDTSSTATPAPDTEVDSDQSGDNDVSEVTVQPGTYLNYSPSDFAKYSNSIRLLSFHADWCPQCRALDHDINNGTVPDGVVIFKVNFDDEGALKRQYGVVQQTTIVRVDSNGNLVNTFGAYSQPTLAAVLNALAPSDN